jgi:hypothetical protein
MKNTLVVVSDLGTFKAFKLDRSPEKHTPYLELLEEYETVDAHGKLLDKVTDQAGRFRVPTAKMAMSYGERQKIELELRKRLIRQLAERLQSWLNRPDIDACYFSCSKEANQQVCALLKNGVRHKIQRNIAQDLTRIDKAKILEHFGVLV